MLQNYKIILRPPRIRSKKELPPSNYRTRFVPDALLVKEANSERNGAFSGDSSTNSKSFEGKVHLHRSSLSDSKDVAKVQQNFETTKDKEQKKNCLLSYHSALIAGASARQLKQSWHRVPSIRKINQLSCQVGSKWWIVIQAFRLQRYEENWYYTHFLAQILVLYPFFGAKLDIISTFT